MDFQIPKSMKAIVYRGKNDLRLETIPVPKLEPGELLVKVAVCGVCPTDIKKIHHGTVPPPRIFGHETAGTIVKINSVRSAFRVGDRVALHHHVPCMRMPLLPSPRLRPMPRLQNATGITAGFEPAGGGYAGIRPSHAVCAAGRRRKFQRATPSKKAQCSVNPSGHSPESRQTPQLVARRQRIGCRAGANWPDVHQKFLSLRGIRVVATDMDEENRVKLALNGGAIEKSIFRRREKRRCQKSALAYPVLDAAIITVPATPVVLEAVDLVRGSAQVLLFAHTPARADKAARSISVQFALKKKI